jgi:hypothetical protein
MTGYDTFFVDDIRKDKINFVIKYVIFQTLEQFKTLQIED